jgi:hypothetical protein
MADTTQTQAQKDSVRQKKGSPAASTQMHMNIAEIKDNVIVLKNGGLRAILQTSSVNFNLKSEEERNSIIYSYQGFLNTLEFPIQICVKSRKLDIDKYIESVREKASQHENKLLKQQTMEYAEYIQKLIEYADIMETNFFVIVPYDPYRTQKLNIFEKLIQSLSSADSLDNIRKRYREFEELKKHLNERVTSVKTGLEACNLRAEQLTTPQLVELFYKIYNPETSKNEKLENIGQMDVEQL